MNLNNFKGELVRDDFTEKQWNEIQLGLDAGFDVSIYAKKYFHHKQMRELRLAQEKGIQLLSSLCDRYLHSKEIHLAVLCIEKGYELKYFVSKAFNFKQKEQIYLGMESKVAYQRYALPIHNEWKMQEVRLAMERGYNLLPYLDTHNHNQLRQIRLGMVRGVNYHVYDDVRFKQAQMAEILAGLREGIDVSNYADYNLSIEEMRLRIIKLKNENKAT